ncbi:hypothetical protein Pmar_PMAR028542 [Perkinsus marinus ATCC 50983]|uniref:Uncharacterized protein n=2 Tax=Perkinsus marinus (strain ATCC 50983 / TXsc) TaxID=423536 RepID=C5KZB9_PERM5|nr:hypothetical protein Pmar_PMAR028542 [Perkinsus marinus ATCC 50983]EER10174.1 hypothetical protein Pmar_PMAR028542 [Perkinsus marinus ATCC 50983]|eukprot:XP_002778379.1 hypothetical protein Pmar_PMAR028542 [Perkinsus marinus ATCC 50983]
MVSNTIKDDLINRGLWNNAKYWSKFGEMLDIGLPVEDSYQMAKEYMDTLNNKESSRRHHAKRVPGKADDKKSNIEDEEVGECPVCGKTGIPLIDLQRHVNDCLQ